MANTRKFFTILFLCGVLFAGLPVLGVTAEPAATTVSVDPPTPSVSNCGILDVYIKVSDVSNLYAIDVRLSFDPNVIEIVDFDPASAVVEVEPIIDPALQFTAGFTVRNEVNNFTGTIWYAATQTSPTPAANGTGNIARLRIRAKSTGTSAFNFTYIKLSNPNGVEITATSANGSISASSSVTPSLAISRLNTSQVQLSWPAHSSGVSQYHLYRSSQPYFFAVDPGYQVIANPGTGTVTFNDSVLGNVTTNYFYTVRAECSSGGKSAASVQVGKFEYQIYETTGTDFSWVGLVLNVAGISRAQDLAAHIQNNSSGTVSVLTISRWNATGQNFSTNSGSINNFTVSVKNPYRIEIDLPGSSGSTIWAQVGTLPSITTDTYTLYETTGTDFTWILQPLDMTAIPDATALASDIQNKSSAPVSVLSISRWNPIGQNYSTFDNQGGIGNFTTRFGYPYRVEVNVNTGTTVTWP